MLVNEQENPPEKPKKEKKSAREQLEAWIWTLVAVFFIRAFVIQGFVVPSGSMEDTLLPGEFLMALKFTYGLEIPFTGIKFFQFRKPGRGEMVIFKYPLGNTDFVKRTVGLPGDTIEIRNKVVYINGVPENNPKVVHKDARVIQSPLRVGEVMDQWEFQRLWESRKFIENQAVRDNFGPIVVPDSCVFVMGDNRDFSSDSRFWGPLPLKLLKGTPFIIYFSWNPSGPWWKVWQRFRWWRMFLPLLGE